MQKGILINRYLPDNLFNQIESYASDLVMTKTTPQTLDLSIRKADVQVCCDFLKNPYLKDTLRLYELNYGARMVQPFLGHDELIGSIEMDKATGFIESQCGYKKKSQWFAAGFYDEIYFDSVLDEIPLWKVAGKIETQLRDVYCGGKKQRTFIIQSPAHLLHTKRIYGQQNQALKNFRESAYGMNPYEGGTNALAQYLLRGRRFWSFDCVRWDRKAPWMKLIYKFRNKYLQDDKFKEWCTTHLIDSHLVLPNGDLITKDWGNNSGSGNTTGDNILGMVFMIYLAFMTFSKGDPNIMDHIFFKCFGDDVIGSDNLPISDEQLERLLRDAFASIGIEFDPFLISNDLGDHTFLGFTFKKIQEGWVPQYPTGTISKSFLYLQHNMKSEGEISKMLSLLYMSGGNGYEFYNLIRHAFIQVLMNIKGEDETDFVRVVRQHGVPEYSDVISWYLGFENSSLVFNFLPKDTFILD